ncbi:MAG: hypothetical protein ACK5RS_03190, partial [Acidobacteriota bacterium]
MNTFHRNQNRQSGSGTSVLQKIWFITIKLYCIVKARLVNLGRIFVPFTLLKMTRTYKAIFASVLLLGAVGLVGIGGQTAASSGDTTLAKLAKLAKTFTRSQSPGKAESSGQKERASRNIIDEHHERWARERADKSHIHPPGPENVTPDPQMISSGINNLARTAGVAKTAADGGPVILDGMDPVWHAVNGENTYIYIGKSLKSIYDLSNGRTNNDKIAVLGTSPTDAGATGGNWSTMMSTKFLTTFGTQPQYDIYSTEAELNAFFSTQIDAASPPRMIWLPDIGGSNTNNRETVFQANAAKIAEFVNNGGGLFANMGQYLWLSKLIPGAVYNGGGCNGGPAVTTVGSTDFGLQNSDVVSCWHGWFTNYGTSLQPLVDWPYPSNSSPRVAVSIGGGSVTLPTNFTLTGTPSSPLI